MERMKCNCGITDREESCGSGSRFAARVRLWPVHFAAMMGHVLAALAFRCSQMCVRHQACHNRRGEKDHQRRRCKWTHKSHQEVSLRRGIYAYNLVARLGRVS